MKLSNFNFNLPKELIASHPAPNRAESRLMVIHKATGKIEHKVFKDSLKYFGDGDVMILNNTKIFPARLYGTKEKTGAKIEVYLLRELNKEKFLWELRPALPGVAPFDRLTAPGGPAIHEGPLVSVILPARNAGATIDAALAGLVAQSWQMLEVLVIDNGSTDDHCPPRGGLGHAGAAYPPSGRQAGPRRL